jgi:hypothetical protein
MLFPFPLLVACMSCAGSSPPRKTQCSGPFPLHVHGPTYFQCRPVPLHANLRTQTRPMPRARACLPLHVATPLLSRSIPMHDIDRAFYLALAPPAIAFFLRHACTAPLALSCAHSCRYGHPTHAPIFLSFLPKHQKTPHHLSTISAIRSALLPANSRTTYVHHPSTTLSPLVPSRHDKGHYRPIKLLVIHWGNTFLNTSHSELRSTFALLEFPRNMHSPVRF